MVHGKKRIPYWIDWRLPGLAGPEYHAVISFGLPIEPEDSQYGEYRIQKCVYFLQALLNVPVGYEYILYPTFPISTLQGLS